jgi:DNA-binding NarL/FixJ family response regulator
VSDSRPAPMRPTYPLAWRGTGGVRDQHEALEHGLANCLRIFSELAAVAGEADRAMRLRAAADLLHGTSHLPLQQMPSPAQTNSALHAPIAHLPRQGSLRKPCSLTRREMQVAELIANGLTNRQIAAELEISERTADTHVQNILNRLGVVSRAQVAAWVASRDVS